MAIANGAALLGVVCIALSYRLRASCGDILREKQNRKWSPLLNVFLQLSRFELKMAHEGRPEGSFGSIRITLRLLENLVDLVERS